MRKIALLTLLFIPVLFSGPGFQPPSWSAAASPTPTYDPFVEPPLPSDPSELELGRNLYWHWCMPCHGDRAQGLTDEFRLAWEPDHQGCWDRGCHGGLPRDEGFPIPTLVPALTGGDRLAHFASLQQLDDYLRLTHPPQSPGLLKAEEYHAIAAWVFELNQRPGEPAPTATPTMPVPSTDGRQLPHLFWPALILAILLIVLFVIGVGKNRSREGS